MKLTEMQTGVLAEGCRRLLAQPLPDDPREAATWLPALHEWRRRWAARGHLPAWGPGSSLELGLLEDVIAELERIAGDVQEQRPDVGTTNEKDGRDV